MPPDYGGTALVINNPPKSVPERDEKNSGTAAPERHGDASRDGGRYGKSTENPADNGRYPRRTSEDPGDYAADDAGIFTAPFGENGQSEQNADGENGEKIGLFGSKNLKTDDLLLLGLIILLMSDKKTDSDVSSHEALLILAVLYLSGM